jgi:hypothetical protein
MWRRTISTASILLAVAAAPATAKGIASGHFTGPGLPGGGMTLIGARRLSQVGLVAPKASALFTLGVVRSELGTPYRAKYHMDYAPRNALRQIVYPYARGGPITFTPRGQHLGQDYESFRGGWHRAGAGLLRLLIRHGFPSDDPLLPDGSVARRDERDQGTAMPAAEPLQLQPWPVVGAAAAIAVGAAFLSRRSAARRRVD